MPPKKAAPKKAEAKASAPEKGAKSAKGDKKAAKGEAKRKGSKAGAKADKAGKDKDSARKDSKAEPKQELKSAELEVPEDEAAAPQVKGGRFFRHLKSAALKTVNLNRLLFTSKLEKVRAEAAATSNKPAEAILVINYGEMYKFIEKQTYTLDVEEPWCQSPLLQIWFESARESIDEIKAAFAIYDPDLDGLCGTEVFEGAMRHAYEESTLNLLELKLDM